MTENAVKILVVEDEMIIGAKVSMKGGFILQAKAPSNSIICYLEIINPKGRQMIKLMVE